MEETSPSYPIKAIRLRFSQGQILKRFISRFYRICGLLVCITGAVLIKLIPVYFYIRSFDYIEVSKGWAEPAKVFIFWATLLFISFPVGRWIIGIGNRISINATRADFRYYDLYGKDYSKPILEDFDLEKEEYYSYNRRFQFDIPLVALMTFTPSLILFRYVVPKEDFNFWLCIMFATSLTLITSFIAQIFNSWYSKKWPQWKKVKDYIYFDNIYTKIQEEVKEDELNECY